MKIQSEPIDMMAELFIDKQQGGVTEYWVPPLSVEELLNIVSTSSDTEEKKDSLKSVVLHYRYKTMPNNGFYTTALSAELASILKKFRATGPLLEEGVYCERIRDFESAIVFYDACLVSYPEDQFIRYYSLNNLGFCLNFSRKFEEAENMLRVAIVIYPGKYNAWKNLGISLEWQGQYEEAAECYLKAYNLSKGEPRSHLHLKRLLDRHPTLKKLPAFA